MTALSSSHDADPTAALAGRHVGLPVSRRVSRHALQTALAWSILPVVLSTVLLAVTSDHLERPTATALFRTYMAAAPMAVGLLWWHRRATSRFGPLLIAFGLTSWVVSWQSSDWALAFDLGVLAEGPYAVLIFALFLAFPSGRLERPADRVLIAAWTATGLLFFVPWALGSPVLMGGGPLSSCVPACPANVLQIGSAAGLVELLGRWESYAVLTLTVASLVVYGWRLLAASRPRRRSLIAVAATSLLFVPVHFTFLFSRLILELDAGTLDTMAWVVVASSILLPLGFLVALLQADLFAGIARGRLLEALARRPTPLEWRAEVAHALDDPGLRLGFWDPGSRAYVEPDGGALTQSDDAGRAWIEIDRDGQPIAAMTVDAVLTDDPELVRAATSATVLAVENGDLEGKVRDSQARILAAGDAERRRIERDLHDSAQQQLVALRIHLAMASEQLDGAKHRTMVAALGAEVEEVLEQLRSVALGVHPALLRRFGMGAALESTARRAAVSVTVEDSTTRRHDEAVELAVYFCCLEALQNVAKHAGLGAAATVRLSDQDGSVTFTVDDDGSGFELSSAERGAGLENMAHRVAAVGGTLRFHSAPGQGTTVTGRLPG